MDTTNARSRLAAVVIALVVAPIAFGAVAAPADARGITTPGYRGTTKAPRTSNPVPEPVKVGDGDLPNVMVDAGGTAHIAWNDLHLDTRTPALHYCRLKRGASSCDNPDGTRVFAQTDGNTGPPFVVAYGDSLVLLTQRRALEAHDLDGGPVYAYVSDDGGESFNDPVLVGGEVSNEGGPSEAWLQGAVTFGPAGSEQIGLVYTGGFFQTVRPGVPAGRLTDLIPGDDQLHVGPNAAIAATPDGGLTVGHQVRSGTLLGQTTLRTWNRSGDPADPAQWSPRTHVPGVQPKMAGGPGGAYLQTRPANERYVRRAPTLTLRKLRADGSAGPAIVLSREDLKTVATPAVDATGVVRTAWTEDEGRALVSRTVTGGSRVGKQTTLLRAKRPAVLLYPAVAALADGGGFAAVRRSAVGGGHEIFVPAFGSQQPTGAPSLGGQPGGGPNTDPGVLETCSRVSFSALDVVGGGGCLLNAVGQPGTKVSDGTLKLNGLEIVPDPGVKIVLNSRQRTFDTTGKVTVQMRLDAATAIPLVHEELHLKLPSEADKTEAAPGCTGTKLMGFDADVSKPFLKGFPIRGQVAVYLGADSACIPVALGLPKAFGDVRGNAVLRLTNEDGLILDSMKIAVDGLYLGPLLVEKLGIEYKRIGNQWDGTAIIGLPPQPGGIKLGGTVRFVDGAFEGATFTASPPFPGLPLVGPTFLGAIGGGFHLNPFELTATATVGAIPLAPGVYTVAIDGKLVITFGDPVVFDFSGKGSLLGFPVATAGVTVTTDGFFRAQGDIDLNLTVASATGGVKVFVDLPSKTFSGRVNGKICVAGYVCPEAEAILSSIGVGACLDWALAEVGFGYRWGDNVLETEIMVPTCDLTTYEPALPAGAPGARAAQAGSRTFTVPEGAGLASIKVTGDGAVPSVALVSPDGQRIVPSTDPDTPGAPAYALEQAATNTTYVGVPKAASGTWAVEAQPGSAAIVELRQAQPLAPPKVSGKLGGKGRKRTLTYEVRRSDGLNTVFVETDARGGSRIIGRATKDAGVVRFGTGYGPKGRRTVTAMTDRNGIPRLETRVGTYTAPGPLRPGRPGKLRVRRSRRGLLVRWGRAQRAVGYTVTAKLSDGRTPFKTVGPRARTVRIPAVPGSVNATVSVVARDRAGRAGPAARGKTARRR